MAILAIHPMSTYSSLFSFHLVFQVHLLYFSLVQQLEYSNPSKTAKPTSMKHADLAVKTSKITRATMEDHRQNFHQDLDVRGMRGDEALNAVMHFLDDSILVGMSRVRILHGTGTGVLRQLIRQYLGTVPNVSHFRDEHVQFGGAGITVVDLD